MQGVLVPPDESALLAEEIQGLFDNEERRETLAAQALERATITFSWDNWISALDDVYEDAISSFSH
jgi:glycosyltransferase involved in cell wall biosynthesis